MEVAGLVVGGVALAALFNTCLDDFKYVRVGLSIGQDYNKYLLQIAVAQRRFSRWGDVLRIGEATPSENQVRRPTDEDLDVLVKLLTCIKAKFEEANIKSNNFLKGRSVDQMKTFDNRDLSATNKECLAALEMQALKTRKDASFWKKTQWALWKKEDFDSLVADLGKYIDGLEALFPSIEVNLRNAYTEDIEGFRSHVLVILREAAEHTDRKLLELASQKEKARATITIIVKDYALLAKGDIVGESWKDVTILPKNSESASYSHVTFSGNSKGQEGNMYGSDVANAFWNAPTAAERERAAMREEERVAAKEKEKDKQDRVENWA